MNVLKRWFWPRSVRRDAISFYKDGLARGERKDSPGALAAYTSAIEMAGAPIDVKAMALYNRALILAAGGALEKAICDLRTVISLPMPLHVIKLAAKRRLERLEHRRDLATRKVGVQSPNAPAP